MSVRDRETPGILVIAACLQGRGGLQRRVRELAHDLAQRNPVTVLTWSPLAGSAGEPLGPGIRVVFAPSLFAWDRDHRPLLAALNTIVSLTSGVAAAVLLRRRWSVAVGVGLHPEGTVAALAAGRGRRFLVTTWLVGPLGNAERLRRSPLRRGVLALLRRASSWVAETAEARTELVALGVPPRRIETIVAGVDLTRLRPRARSSAGGVNRAVYTGRFDLRQKRLDLLLDAWGEAALQNWELILAGDGPDEAEIRRRASLQATARVVAWWQEVAGLLTSADCFVLPSEAETSALGMLEGMAHGLPGIVSATPGLSARLPDGVLLVANEREAWVDALRRIDALGPGGRDQEGRRARAWVHAHADRHESSRRWLELLEGLTA